MSSLFPGFDISMFVQRPQPTPYVAPRAPDISGILDALGGIGGSITHARDRATRQEQLDEENRQAQQRLALQKAQQDEQTRFHDIQDQRYQAQDARLQKSEMDKHIAEIQKAMIDARSRGDQGTEQALLGELGRLTGWSMTEHASNYQAPPEAAPQAPPAAAAGPQGPTDFDQAYQAMVQKESGGNPRAVNPKSGALGTFQLMQDQLPPGVTKDQFLAMSPDEQKQVYLNNYLPAHGLSKDTLQPGDVGMSIGAPAAITMPDEAVVYKKGSNAVRDNPTWDRNKDGQITAAELRANYGGGPPASIARPEEPQAPQGPPAPFLQDFMGQQGPAQEQAPSGAMPWEMLGLGSPPPAGPEQEVKGGGRYVFRDASGKTMYEYDRTKVQGDQREAVKSGLQPLLDNASTDEEKKAARAAIGFASGTAGNGLNPKEAITQGMQFYEKALAEQGKTARGGGDDGFRQLKQLQTDSDRATTGILRQYAIPKLNEAEHDLDDGLAAVGAHNGLGDTAALAHFAQAMTHRLTDFEFRNFADSSGVINTLMNTLNRLTTGERTPEVMAQLKQQLEASKASISAMRQKAADTAAQTIIQGSQYPMITPDMRMQYANRAMQQIMGAGTPAGGAPAGGGGYGTKSLDDLEKELGGQ